MNTSIANIMIAIAILGLVISCNNRDDNYYFKGEIRYFDDDCSVIENVESKFVPLHGVGMGMIAAYDSLLFCWSPTYPDYFFNVFNVNTGEEIGFFCGKGRGNRESISLNCIYQFFKKGDDLMTLLYASNEGKLFLWNISQSIKQGVTVYDTIVSYKNDRMFFQFYQSEDVLFAYKPSDELSKTEATTPFYEKRTIYTDDLMGNYPIYKIKSVRNRDAKSPMDFFFYTWDVMKPDGTKIVQVMRHLPQMNIIDTRSGDVVGYRLKDGPDFSILQTDLESMHVYYNSVHADDHYIYATYWGKEPWVDRIGVKMPFFNTIHVFDWNGKLCYKLMTDQSYYRVWSDSIRKRLYTINMETEEVYYLDLKELNLN